jgi:hypothetical protein
MDVLLGNNAARGRVRASKVDIQGSEELWTPSTDWKSNLVLYQWATITSQLLAVGSSNYRIAGMYLEFENVASPSTTVTPPSFDRTRDITYYDDLVASSTRDYLRVPMTAAPIGSEGTDLSNNQIVFFARSSGTQGVHGKTFSDSVNSKIFGASLVAFVDNNDSTQDLLFSSFYFDTADQQIKLATSQVGIEWELTLQ